MIVLRVPESAEALTTIVGVKRLAELFPGEERLRMDVQLESGPDVRLLLGPEWSFDGGAAWERLHEFGVPERVPGKD